MSVAVVTRHFVTIAGGVVGHLALVAIGLVMMVVGLALGVTMVLLPVGIVVGTLGVLSLVAGLFGHFTDAG